jgi:hypothetical protein
MIVSCFFLGSEKDWKSSTKVDLSVECGSAQAFYIAIGFIPYWFRFAQCWRKVYDDPQKNKK